MSMTTFAPRRRDLLPQHAAWRALARTQRRQLHQRGQIRRVPAQTFLIQVDLADVLFIIEHKGFIIEHKGKQFNRSFIYLKYPLKFAPAYFRRVFVLAGAEDNFQETRRGRQSEAKRPGKLFSLYIIIMQFGLS